MCETKICSHCGRELLLSAFSKMTKSEDGLQYSCKICQSQLNKESRARKKEEQEERARLNQKALMASPAGAVVVTTDDGRRLIRLQEASERKSLQDFQSRELLEEIKRRGYVWENMYIKTKVDYAKI